MANDDLKKALEAELVAEAREKQNKIKQAAIGYAAMGRKEQRIRDSAAADVLWADLDKMAASTVEGGQKGYDTWLSSIGSILELCHKLRAALHADNPIKSVANMIYDKAAPIAGTLTDMAVSKVTDKFCAAPKVTLPSLHQYVDFTDDGKLDVSSLAKNLVRSDGKPFTQPQKDILNNGFQKGIEMWLELNGYKKDPAPGKKNCFVNEIDETALTKAKFEEMRDDPATGLNKFLSGEFDMNFVQALGPRP